MRRFRSRFAWFACILLAWGTSCAPSKERRSFVLVSIDTLRADRLGAYGNPEVRTPGLDRLAREGLQFCQAYSVAPTTLSSHASMLTGAWPSGHGVPRNGWPLDEEVVCIAETLRDRGVRCGGFVSSAALHPKFQLGQGFEIYDYESTRSVEREQGWRTGAETLGRALAWWRSAASDSRFLFVHLFEPHFPYEPEAPWLRTYEREPSTSPANGAMDFLFALWEDPTLFDSAARDHLLALYHAEISGLDRTLRAAIAEFREDPGCVVLVTADHGESLGEHGLRFKHGPYVYTPDTHIPLLLVGGLGVPSVSPARDIRNLHNSRGAGNESEPGGVAGTGDQRGAGDVRDARHAGGVRDALVRGIDVAPTVLSVFGAPQGPQLSEARSLFQTADSAEELPVFAEASMPWEVETATEYPNRGKQRVLRTRTETIVVTPWMQSVEWFDRTLDPGEERPLPLPSEEETRVALERLEDWGKRGAPREAPTGIDPDLLRQLHGLGYTDR